MLRRARKRFTLRMLSNSAYFDFVGDWNSPWLQIKKARMGFWYLARPERFELLTTWFEARYSIQLSYGRIVEDTSTKFGGRKLLSWVFDGPERWIRCSRCFAPHPAGALWTSKMLRRARKRFTLHILSTPDHLVRSQILYPAELRAHGASLVESRFVGSSLDPAHKAQGVGSGGGAGRSGGACSLRQVSCTK